MRTLNNTEWGGGGGRGANISFPNRSAMARVLSLWRSIEKKGSESETSRQSRV